jgi:metal-responsive CopG/Arc/MetJ family transcriptional regulator
VPQAGGTVSVRVGPGRPKVGEGSVVVPVSLEASLLRRVVAFARDAGTKRSEVVSRALELLVDGKTEFDHNHLQQRD